MTTTLEQRCYGGVADGASFYDSPVPHSFVAAVYVDEEDLELCGCDAVDAEPIRAAYRLDELLSDALGHWVYVPLGDGE
jgi:hypothetical protein